jgi:acyl transferase domain-containing protein/NADPH:quinone reductase-like Zn-dependent oxidoreductase/acyl carrier protein
VTRQHSVECDPIAVVGVGLRLPGGISSLSELWWELDGGSDMVGPVPEARFDASAYVAPGRRPGKSYADRGGFLDDVAGFDAGFFGISPKEASRMDPQQRLVLECAVDALDDAGIALESLAGGDTAVVIGISGHDYADLQARELRSYNAYTMAGSAACNAANRISYVLDLHGPSNAVDTACSSSLSAVHQACEALRAGHSGVALAGGVNVLLSPSGFIGFSQASMLSPSGRCHPFSEAADGYVRAEGAGVVVLKPLSAALADGDRVHAVILASGVNADGRTAGLSLPSADAQGALLERVYADAGIAPDQVSYVEAHGTGTQAGDPIECQALGRVLGAKRGGEPLSIGSVKSNLGHMEAAAGLAGLAKALVVLRHRRVPATLHSAPLNPSIDFAGLGLRPAVAAHDLPESERLVVGVNSFGFGGANAHVVLAQPPEGADTGDRGPSAGARLPVVLSARSPQALAEAAATWAGHFRDMAGAEEFYDAAYTACRRRTLHEHRLALLAADPAEAVDVLSAAAQHGAPGAATGRAAANGRIAFVFSGNGTQWAGMGAELLERDAAFAAEVAAVDAELSARLGWSVREELAQPEPDRWALTEVAQPLLFAVQAGLTASLAARGIRPAAVVGHSVGEVAAAYCAGILDRAQACHVISERSRAQGETAGAGRMAAIGMPEHDMVKLIEERYADKLVVAGVNSDADVTVAGDSQAISEMCAAMESEGVFARDLGLDYAFHGPSMDKIHEPLLEALHGLHPGASKLPMYSTVSGAAIDGQELDAAYWWRNIREPVRFSAAIAALTQDESGCGVLLEVGPHPALARYLHQAVSEGETTAVVGTLSRRRADSEALDDAWMRLAAAGADIDWTVVFPAPGHVVDLPAYPWQREEHWNGRPEWWTSERGALAPQRHPLLGIRQAVAEPAWSLEVDLDKLAWMRDHKVSGAVVWPAAGYIDALLGAGDEVFDGSPVEVRGLSIERALTLPSADEDEQITVSVTLSPDNMATIASRTGADGAWTEHARGRVRRLAREQPPAIDPAALEGRAESDVEAEEHYRACARAGLDYGPAFRPLASLRRGGDQVLARYRATVPAEPGYLAHPTLIDGALQAGMPLLGALADPECPFLPAEVEAVRYWHPVPREGVIHVTASRIDASEAVWDIVICDADGAVAVELEGCRLRRFEAGRRPRPELLSEALHAAPLPDERCEPSPLPDPHQIFESCRTRLEQLAADWDREEYDVSRDRILEMSAHFTAAAIAQLVPVPSTEGFDLGDLISAGVDAKHVRLIRVLMEQAEGHGILGRTGEHRWRVTRTPCPEQLFARVIADFPADATTAITYAMCGRHLAEVLCGQADPLQLLFSEADALAARFYDSAAILAYHSRVAASLIADIAARWPADRPLRVLELGAGTGATTAALVSRLPHARTRYTFTDVSAGFFPQAQQRFSDVAFLNFKVLDLEQPLEDQGFHEDAFDLVIAANVLHATSDLAQTLRRASDLLADGGHLLAVESHSLQALAPVFGLLDTFWANNDPNLRPVGPLLTYDQWPGLLQQCGFDAVAQSGLSARPAHSDNSVILASRAHRGEHREPDHDLADRSWLIADLTDGAKSASPALVAAAIAFGRGHRMAEIPLAHDEDCWQQALASVQPTDIVLVCDAEAPWPLAVPPDLAVRHIGALRALARAQAGQDDALAAPRLWLITPGQAAPDLPPSTGAAAIWGAARTFANEHPATRVRRIACLATPDEAGALRLAKRLARELSTIPDEDEVLLTATGRFATRFDPGVPAATAAEPDSYSLAVVNPGLNYRLTWQQRPIPAPGPGRLVVKVAAAALNYRDIMLVTGTIPPSAFGRQSGDLRLGLECAGTVVAVGPGVTTAAVGDRVAAIADSDSGSGCFGSHALIRADRIIPIPREMSFAEAATMPVAFITVHHALGHLARLSEGETVLVHGAAGGVGLAAIQHARMVGATVIATAGTPAKRELISMLGVADVLDSRSLRFADQVRDLTDDQGVDVVLNSLAGEALVRGVEVLKPFGRFLELGKRDFVRDSPMPLAPFLRNLTFYGVDVTPLFEQDSPLAADHFAALNRAIATGQYRPLPHRRFPAERIHEAFTTLKHSRHVGKVVVTYDDAPKVAPAPTALGLDHEAAYLITGGLGGFGAATARHLASRGARHLVLASRRGATTPEANALLSELECEGVDAVADVADVADPEALAAILARLDATGRRLAGVVHAAMVLDDGPLLDLDDDRLAVVLTPKTSAAAALDNLTRDRDLDFFIVYSSVAAAAGNIRQSAYVAGNLAMEAIVRDRRRHGLSGLAVQWGAVTDTGFVQRTGRVDEMRAYGLGDLSSTDALIELDRLIQRPALASAAVGRFDWDGLHRAMPALDAPRTSHLLSRREDTEAAQALQAQLAQGDFDQARRLVEERIATLLAAVLQTSADRLDHTRRLDQLGVDSLMSLELATAIRADLNCALPVVELTSAASLTDLAARVAKRLTTAE